MTVGEMIKNLQAYNPQAEVFNLELMARWSRPD